jgi:Cas7 group CRISPR-associated protein Csh2
MSEKNENTIRRATGLLVIEVVNSNPNGDPDRESDPRTRPDRKGEISPVSFKRKLRDLLEDKDGPAWQTIKTRFTPPLDASKFEILESPKRVLEKVFKEAKEGKFLPKYWDARVFGNTLLEKNAPQCVATGVVQFGLGLSISPIVIERMTNTNKSPVQANKTRGMAPLAYRVVEHGVYTMPFFVNASAARKTECTVQDIEILQYLIPLAYSQTSSYIRASVEIRHAWYVEHKSPLGSASDLELIAALTPRKRERPEEPSKRWEDYEAATALPEGLQGKVAPLRDLMAEAYAAVSS